LSADALRRRLYLLRIKPTTANGSGIRGTATVQHTLL
jgi:hypothetical protein